MGNKNIFLTGATGFLGIHILEQILKTTIVDVYCLVRGDSQEIVFSKLLEKLRFYFGNKYDHFLEDRIHVIKGDFSQPDLGLPQLEYQKLGECIDVAIHAGALVKHFGLKEEFEKVNINGTEEMIRFALKYGIYLSYVSTTAVAEMIAYGRDLTVISENDLHFGTSFTSNVYAKSKFEAEKIFYEAFKSGLNGSILRVGALTGRYEDGVFQSNVSQNALYSRMKVIIDSGAIPEDILSIDMEYTPVDFCSSAIVKIITSDTKSGRVFHLFNHNYIKFYQFVSIINELGIPVEKLKISNFSEYRNLLMESDAEKDLYTGFFLYFRRKEDKQNKPEVRISSENSVQYLKGMGFNWPEIDKQYIGKVINYLRSIGYILR